MPDSTSTTTQCASLIAARNDTSESPHYYSWTFPGTTDQVRVVRRVLTDALGQCPASDDIVLCASELAANAARHSASANPGGTFTVNAEIADDAGVYLEVADDGGPWQTPSYREEHMHGLNIVRSLSSRLSVTGSASDGWTVRAWFNWNPPTN
jgi:anti-sigma regulatory factor (Ser/Thr protein kinase)